MRGLKSLALAFARNDSGATAIEYGMVAAFIALACVITIQNLGAQVLTELYEKIVAAWAI